MIEKRLPFNVYLYGLREGQCKTIQDRIIRYLVIGCNACEVETRLRKRAFAISSEPKELYFVGSKGSIRKGKNATNSRDISGSFMKRLQIWEGENEL